MMKNIKKIAGLLLVGVMAAMSIVACGKKKTEDAKVQIPDAKTATYEQVVKYLQDSGVIAKDAKAVDINTNKGYVKDNTNGSFEIAKVADKAFDYNGLWLLWYDVKGNSDLYQSCFENIEANGGTIALGGGAATLETKAYKGNFAIAFAENFAKKDEALKAFKAMTAK